jgi:hypothetical protein
VSSNKQRILPDYFLTPRDSRPIGYAALVLRHGLATLPHHRWSFAATRGGRRELDRGRVVHRVPHDPDAMSDVDHVLFSLKHDGLALPILAELFATLDQRQFEGELSNAIRETPNGQYHRRLWYLYEWFTGNVLAVDAAPAVGYVHLVEPDAYYTGRQTRHARQRIIDNLPGNRRFCPIVRRTPALSARSSARLRERLEGVLSAYDADLLARALAFIYTKETRSSFAIENEKPSASRADRFASVLKRVSDIGELTESELTRIQNRIVEPRFAEEGFRSGQNYVGESLGLHRQLVHYVPPRPENVHDMMTGFLRALRDHDGHVDDAVVWAASVSFGFVFIHPFEDGNGRLHRLLIHYILGRNGVTPPQVIVPVSAVMLARRDEYDRCLETFSRPLMQLVDYELDTNGFLTVANQTDRYYRYFDATPMAEALYVWLDEAIDGELRTELSFLLAFRNARAAMDQIVDLPDQLANLFVKVVVSNGGRLAKRKRDQFSMLSDDEVSALEQAVRDHFPAETMLATPSA